jgi:hypothetical protein
MQKIWGITARGVRGTGLQAKHILVVYIVSTVHFTVYE